MLRMSFCEWSESQGVKTTNPCLGYPWIIQTLMPFSCCRDKVYWKILNVTTRQMVCVSLPCGSRPRAFFKFSFLEFPTICGCHGALSVSLWGSPAKHILSHSSEGPSVHFPWKLEKKMVKHVGWWCWNMLHVDVHCPRSKHPAVALSTFVGTVRWKLPWDTRAHHVLAISTLG